MGDVLAEVAAEIAAGNQAPAEQSMVNGLRKTLARKLGSDQKADTFFFTLCHHGLEEATVGECMVVQNLATKPAHLAEAVAVLGMEL